MEKWRAGSEAVKDTKAHRIERLKRELDPLEADPEIVSDGVGAVGGMANG